ncbi:MAG: N-acyl-D-amino-acid deacylase family protein, partial [Planctomycetota bacterium]
MKGSIMRSGTFCLRVVVIVCSFAFCTPSGGAAKENIDDCDILIKNAKVFDGSGAPAFSADVAIRNDTIVKVQTSIGTDAERVIDGNGLHVCPGFIDLHTHVDSGMYFPEHRACLNYLKQGVTTVVVGQCGGSAWPIFEKAEDQMRRWTKEGIGPNAALLVGHGTVRQIVVGDEDREPTSEELARMRSLVEEAMEQGACGLSTGLIYAPSSYAKTDEIVELVLAIKPYRGIYHTHIRGEGEGLLKAVNEAIEVAEKTGVAVHISHFKAIGKKNWGSVKQACELIEKARRNNLKITADQYPYRFSRGNPYTELIPESAWRRDQDVERLTSSDVRKIFGLLRDSELIELYKKTTPYVPITERHERFLNELPRRRLVRLVSQNLLSPSDFQGPGNARERMLFLERMKDPNEAEEIRKAVGDHIDSLSGAEDFIIGTCVEEDLEGKSIKEAAAIKGKSIPDVAIELELMGARCVPLKMSESDIEYIMKKDYVGTGSDGTVPAYGIGLPHIRSYSTFLYKIKKYALEREIISLPHVIRSQTSLPAQIMNWDDRGWIRPGYTADVVVLDLDNIVTGASITQPH